MVVMEQVTMGLGDANFNDPAWDDISAEAMDFVRHLMTYEEDSRPTGKSRKSSNRSERPFKFPLQASA